MANLVLVLADHELVDRARRGDRNAFGQLAQKHRAMCMRLSRGMMRNAADAEDSVQTALLKAFVHLDQFNGTAAFSTWLAEIVIRQCKMGLRSLGRRRTVSLVGLPHECRPVSRFRDPESAYRLAELRRLVRREVARIDPFYRPALRHDLDELPVPAIARLMGITVACAKSRVFRARAQLQTRLAALY